MKKLKSATQWKAKLGLFHSIDTLRAFSTRLHPCTQAQVMLRVFKRDRFSLREFSAKSSIELSAEFSTEFYVEFSDELLHGVPLVPPPPTQTK